MKQLNSPRFLIGAVMIAALALVVIPAISNAAALNRSLGLGSTGADVTVLQQFLAQDATMYPSGLTTGYFGSLTSAAVSTFQTRNGIAAVGVVGPVTLPVLNLQISGGMGGVGMVGNTTPAPVITQVNVSKSSNNATVSWNTNEVAQGVVYYSTSPLTTYEYPNSVTVSGNSVMTDANYRTSQSVYLPNLQSNTTYYYMVYSTGQTGNVSVTLPTTFQTTN